ncbi:coilin-like [Rutidosis leptorrhynchoides]|uniref:coilin-like n=1 Tax=Rutidosis leptorrhynchoides TaxID=125765 RepID=UPI003A9A5A5C
MGTPSLRLRLVFEDRSILTKIQRSDGMNQSWILLKSQQYRTISDVCTYLLHIFQLHRSCPNGIILSMDGFALPPFESTEILQDKEIISVKKRGGATLEVADGDKLLDEAENDKGLLLLANDKETGEYESESESERVDVEHSEDEELPVDANSRKRKANENLENVKLVLSFIPLFCYKLFLLAILSRVTCSNHKKMKIPDCKSKASEETNTIAATSSKKVKSSSIIKRSKELQEKIEEANQETTAPGAKKGLTLNFNKYQLISRSARRKKAKRQWMRELAKIGKKKTQPSSKPEVTRAKNKEANGQPKGLLHWKQASKMPVQNGDVGPSGTKPGHIRFEYTNEDQPRKQIGVSSEISKWKGSNNKRKGQNWSRDKFSTARKKESRRSTIESFKVLFKNAQVPVIDPNDFDKLPPCSEPNEGDVIAYRLLELNSSWIPEFSSFRVGRISYYDARDIVLIQVPEYPIAPENINEDGPNGSVYGEDGTLEINYSALVDVRIVKQYEPDAEKTVNDNGCRTPLSDGKDKDVAENLVYNSNDNKTDASKDSNPGDGEVSAWDRFSKVNPEVDPYVLNQCSYDAGGPSSSTGPDANKASSEDKELDKANSLDPPSSENNASWTNLQKTGPTENNCETGSSWGRPWSEFVVSRPSSAKQTNWQVESSRGNERPWSRGAPRGRGRGRGRDNGLGRGRGRNGNMM